VVAAASVACNRSTWKFHAVTLSVRASAAVETDSACAGRCEAWSHCSCQLGQAGLVCWVCSNSAEKSCWHTISWRAWALTHNVTVTQHIWGHTHTSNVSAAPWHTVQHHACTMSSAQSNSISFFAPHTPCGCCQSRSVQQSQHLLWQAPCAPFSLSLTISARTPAATAAKARTHMYVYGWCCARATVSSRKKSMYRLRQQRRNRQDTFHNPGSLPGLGVHMINQPQYKMRRKQP
jgi:hypothetical protein